MLFNSRSWSVVSGAVLTMLIGYLIEVPSQAAKPSPVPGASASSATASATASVVATKAKKKTNTSKKARKRAKMARRAAALATPTATPAPTPAPAPAPTPEPTPEPTPDPPPPPAGPCGDPVYRDDGSTLECTFAENFDGSTLSADKWSALTTRATGLGQKNNDCWLADNVSVAGGALQLTTRREQRTCVRNDGTSFDATHTSGSVSTYGKFDQAFGRFEIRARFPQVTTPGSQASLWLWPSTIIGVWPASGEIDIAEFYSHYPDRVIPYLHYLSATLDPTVTNNYCFVDNPSEFHTYLLEWYPGRITVKYDGKTCIEHAINPALPLIGSAPFDTPYFINLTQMLGQGLNVPSEATPDVLTTEVDWVRAWK